MNDAPVLYDKLDAVALVTLNRPAVLNAYNMAMRDALFEVLQAVRDDPEIRVMVLQGNGAAFCSGGDISEFGRAPSPIVAREVRWRRDVWGLLWTLPKLTIAAVHGAVIGGGFEMVLLCDACIAATDAHFALPETGLGMIPGVGGTQTAPRHLGASRAMDAVLTGRPLDARTAQRFGFVSEVVPRRTLRRVALDRARQWTIIPAQLATAVKRAVNDGMELPIDEALALEWRVGFQHRDTETQRTNKDEPSHDL